MSATASANRYQAINLALPFGFARRLLVAALALIGLARCGGGGGDDGPAMEGSTQTRSIASQANRTTYPLNVYLPPASAGNRATLPVVYALDGESRFSTLVDIVERTRTRVIIVGIGNEPLRSRDYVPLNQCTPGGGGHVAFLTFMRQELIPFVESSIGGSPTRRILLGHSHGGSFVFYALFAQAAADHTFASYLASDASVGCMTATADQWQRDYSAANAALPVRLHVSYGPNVANIPYAQQIQGARYTDLALRVQEYPGGHLGMIPTAFADAIAFALAPTP